jgi:hypothetical protein
VPPHPASDACAGGLIEGYFKACLENGTAFVITCQQFVAAHGACAACLLPPSASDPPGALVQHPGGVDVNVAGCLALETGDATPAGCAAAYEAAADCAAAACADCTDDACPARALAGPCARWQARTCGEKDGGPAGACTGGGSFEESYLTVATVFCASATDGGP